MNGIMAFFEHYPLLAFLLRVICATFCGALIGLERTKRSKEAGIRTHCIIACAAALIMIISKYGFPDPHGADPARVAAQVVTGISFLGAGVIFKNGNTVKGLTTAAGIWATSAVGLAFGCGMYAMAFFTTVLILVVQMLMHHYNVGNDAFSTSEIRIKMTDTPEIRAALREKQKEMDLVVNKCRITSCDDNTLELVLDVRSKNTIPFEEAVRFMDDHPEIKSLSV